MLKGNEDFERAVMVLFSSNPEAWRIFEKELMAMSMKYAAGAVSSASNVNFQQQLLGKFENCYDLANYRKRLEEKAK
jgi:hypothetical protein